MCFCVSFLICTKREKVHLSLQSTWRYFDKLCYSNTAFSKVKFLCRTKAYLNWSSTSPFSDLQTQLPDFSFQHPFTYGRFHQLISTQQEAASAGRSCRLGTDPQKLVLLLNSLRARCDPHIMSSASRKASSVPAKLQRAMPQLARWEGRILSAFQILSP